MPDVYIERRPDGTYAVIVKGNEKASAITPTQKEGIERAKEMYPNVSPDIERVRNTKKGTRDHWR